MSSHKILSFFVLMLFNASVVSCMEEKETRPASSSWYSGIKVLSFRLVSKEGHDSYPLATYSFLRNQLKKEGFKKGIFKEKLEDKEIEKHQPLINVILNDQKITYSLYSTYRTSLESLQTLKNLQNMQQQFQKVGEEEARDPQDDSQTAQDVKETEKQLKKMETEYALNDSITEEDFISPLKTHYLSYFYKQDKDSQGQHRVRIIPFSGKVLTYSKQCFYTIYDLFSLVEDPSPILPNFFKHLKETFPQHALDISALLDDKNTFGGHFSYVHLYLADTKMDVKVYDPMLFSLAPQRSKSYFSTLARTCDLSLRDHNYRFMRHQITNRHDCGRFSTIYLLKEVLEDKSPLLLSGTEMEKELKKLKENGYETYQLNPKTKWGIPLTEKQEL